MHVCMWACFSVCVCMFMCMYAEDPVRFPVEVRFLNVMLFCFKDTYFCLFWKCSFFLLLFNLFCLYGDMAVTMWVGDWDPFALHAQALVTEAFRSSLQYPPTLALSVYLHTVYVPWLCIPILIMETAVCPLLMFSELLREKPVFRFV